MSKEAFAYVAGGAGGEATMRANRQAFERVSIVPRALRDVSRRDTSVELFGRTLATPLLLAPIGVLDLAHPEGDVAAARAAASVGVPVIFSSQASRPMEDVAAAIGESPRWFQLYWSTVDELVESFVGRAVACGCEAIMVTLDTTLLGWRPRDLDLAYLPFLRGRGIAQYTSDPVFQRLVRERGRRPVAARRSLAALRTLRELRRNVLGLDPRAAVQTFTEIYSRPSLRWDDLARIRELTQLPVVLKGFSTRTMRRTRPMPASTRSWSPIMAAASSMGRSRRSRLFPGSSRPSRAEFQSCWTAAFEAAAMYSRRSRSAPRRFSFAGHTSTGSRSRARQASTRCCGISPPTSTLLSASLAALRLQRRASCVWRTLGLVEAWRS
jgi:isopentenyl diphosphate isomerase/L-lactate dehydrogenase-like FMN-dependent dehydrogenase